MEVGAIKVINSQSYTKQQTSQTVLMKNEFDILNSYEHGSTSVEDGQHMRAQEGCG